MRSTGSRALLALLLGAAARGGAALSNADDAEILSSIFKGPGNVRSYVSGSNHYDANYGAIPADECDKIIKECERIGFNQIEDSIDSSYADAKPSQDIYVFDEGKNMAPTLWAMLQPHMPGLAAFVTARKHVLLPEEPMAKIGWVFVRKYSSEAWSTRNRLRVHQDSNYYSVNIQLNRMEDYSGGGLFVVDAKAARARFPDGVKPDQHGRSEHDMPSEFDKDEWLAKITRVNTSELHFPWFGQGTALLHNNTVWHGIASVTTGVRYSLLMFFDTRHGSDLRSGAGDRDEDSDERAVEIVNHHTRPLEVFWLGVVGKEMPGASSGVLRPGGTMLQNSYVDHVFEARDLETGRPISRWNVPADKQTGASKGEGLFVFDVVEQLEEEL